jgi:hypothetical protein
MSDILQYALVAIVVAVAAFWLGRRLYRSLTGKESSTSCCSGSCPACAPQEPAKLSKINTSCCQGEKSHACDIDAPDESKSDRNN